MDDRDRRAQRQRQVQRTGGQSRQQTAEAERTRRPTSNKARRKKNLKRRRQRSLLLLTIFVGIIAVSILCATFLWKRYGPSKEKANLKEYYGITDENQLAVIMNNEVLEAKGLKVDGKVYLDYATVRDYLNGRFYWDANENLLLYTLPNDVVSVGVGNKDYTISKKKQTKNYVILKTEGNTAYIALDFVKEYTDIEYRSYDNGVKRVVVDSDWQKKQVGTVKRKAAVRKLAGNKSPILTEVTSKQMVTVLETEGSWKKVRTEDGFIGYMKERALKNIRTKKYDRVFVQEEYTNIQKDYTINLAWHQVTSEAANDTVLSTIANTKGLTTISPTWFTVRDTKGNLTSIASTKYVNYAHQSNIEVWGLVRNFDPIGGAGIHSSAETHELLSRTSSRRRLINQLIAQALQVGLDGINVDFETVASKTGEHYIQFIRELSIECRKNGLILSVDNYVPKGYNAHYNIKEQGIVADYVVLMGYDEHFGGSFESGSVASIGYVKDGIEQTLKDVPAEKVINAMPLYTRLWKEVPKTEEELAKQAGKEAGKYPLKVTSETYAMNKAKQVVKDHGAKFKWNEETGQYYAEWKEGEATYKMWLEDKRSLEEKLKVMKEHQLGGVAVWKLGFETADVWDLILKYVN